MRKRAPQSCSFALLAFSLLCLLPWRDSAARDITIDSAHEKIENEMLLLDADARFEFSEDALKAIDSGIPLTIQLEVTVAQARRYWWDSPLVKTHRKLIIERHALSNQFLLIDKVSGERRIFSELTLAIAELGRIRNLPLVEIENLTRHRSYAIGLRLWLDLRSLPGPLIPIAYVSPGWHMSSGWYRWQMDR